MPGLIDTHCHLDFPYEGKSVGQLIDEARAEGVEKLITIATDPASLLRLEGLSQFPHVYFATGIHPHDASAWSDEVEDRIRALAVNPKCVALGEMGLDFYYNHSAKEKQIEIFQKQLELALAFQLPVVIHARDAEDEMVPLLREYALRVASSYVPGVIHCFSGTDQFAQACLELGFSLSFSGILTFKKSNELRSIFSHVPIDRILVETDAPFLAPVPFRGKRCEPKMVKQTALQMAELRQMSYDSLVAQTTQNAYSVFPKLAFCAES